MTSGREAAGGVLSPADHVAGRRQQAWDADSIQSKTKLALTPTLSRRGEGWREGERSATIFQTDTQMKRNTPLLLALLLTAGCASIGKTSRNTGPWDLAALKQAPPVEWGARTGLVQEVFYQGEPFHGKPTRIFAYLGRPATGAGPFPAMV